MATKNVTTDVNGFDKLENVVGSDALSVLDTTDKSSLVAAVNEVRGMVLSLDPDAGGAIEADEVNIADAGGLYTATHVEGALAEVKTLADTLDGLVFGLAVVEMSAQAEAGNARQVNIQLRDLDGDPYAVAGKVLFELIDAEGKLADSAAWTLAETGGGTELSTTAKSALLVQCNASGEAIITVTDVSGVYASGVSGLVRLKATPYNDGGSSPPGFVSMCDLSWT